MSAEALTYRRSRAENLPQRIEREIVSGSIGDGQHLGTKAELVSRFDTAPGTLNEALRILGSRGLVRVRPGPGGGVFVKAPSPLARLGHGFLESRGERVTIVDLLRVRHALEPLVAADAAREASAGEPLTLDVLLGELRASRDDRHRFFRTHWVLHRRIGELSSNAALRALYGTLIDLLEEALLDVIDDGRYDIEELYDVHRKLVEAIQSGDPASALRAAERHDAVTTATARRAAAGLGAHADGEPS